MIAWYEGACPITKEWRRLPRTKTAEWVAYQLIEELKQEEKFQLKGKMYGVLLVEDEAGKPFYLKAFSGFFQGKKEMDGWVPTLEGGDRLLLEEQEILAKLREIHGRMITLEALPERELYRTQNEAWQKKIDDFNAQRRINKKLRQKQREQYAAELEGDALAAALDALQQVSNRESNQKRSIKKDRDQEIGHLQTIVAEADEELNQLRKRRKTLSRNLQKRMHKVYSIKNFAGESHTIADLFPQGMPTGTGECCAPKLLNYAAKNRLTPVALAEFWWGDDSQGKVAGDFYLACVERCQPILGFLLSGLKNKTFQDILKQPELPLDIIYEDHHILAVHKPSGLASIPGRSSHYYDSAYSRLKRDLDEIHLVHRLDQDTSGVLLFAKTALVQKQLQQQFVKREIHKVYEALLEKPLLRKAGTIKLPLWSDPHNRPYQKVNFDQGKASTTQFTKIGGDRIELKPITGRTHQLRVHCSHPKGLNNPIKGDPLYGRKTAPRLYLHAAAITLTHPETKEQCTISRNADF